MWDTMYRVAENKIPPADNMQFLLNQLPDFKHSWSRLILTLLRIEQCTMHPPHLNYATTLPCKTLTMKITIFIVMLVLKSEENIACCYQFKTPWQQFISEDVFKVSGPSFHTSSKFFDDVQYGLVDKVLWQIVSCGLQDFLQLVDGIWLGLKCLVALKHSSTDMIAKRVEVRWDRWPFVFSDEVTAVGGNPVLSQL